MARDLGKNVEQKFDGETKDDRRAAELIQALYEQGSTVSIPESENVISFQLPLAKKEAYAFNEEKIAEWEASGPDEDHRDVAIDLLRRRAAVCLFRASQVMYALEGNKETVVGKEMARWYGNESFLNQYIMFGDAINDNARANDAIQKKQDIAASRVARSNALFRMLDKLPKEFSRDDMKKQLVSEGKSEDSARMMISRMIPREMIMETEHGFKKLIE